MTDPQDLPRPAPPDPLAGVSALEKADAAVARAVFARRRMPLMRALSAIAALGDQPPLQIVSLTALGAGLATGNRRLARAGLRMAAANVLALLAKNFIKQRIDRTRPGLLILEGRYAMRPGRSDAHGERSFPSGHSACAVAAGLAFAREYPEHARPLRAAASLIALSQVPSGSHYPTDVAAGSVIGFLSEWAAARLLPGREA